MSGAMTDADRQRPGILLLLLAFVALAFVPLVLLWGTRLSAGPLGGFAGVGVFVGFVAYFLVFHVYLPYRVYADARRRGANAPAWTAVAFFLPLLGVVAYFLVVVAGSD
jgi:hypothetical protein